MVTIINALTFTTGGILGYLIGTIIEHRLARIRSIEAIRITEFNRGAAAFRAVFTDVKLRLRDNSRTEDELISRIITRDVRIDHEKAKILFEPFLTVAELIGFNSAWDNYENCHNNFYMRDETYQHSKPLGRKEESEYCLDQLESLLAYAKPHA